MSLDAGQLIAGKYRLNRLLARGGMGAVWVAHHEELQVDVALKFQREERAEDERGMDRFRREARAAARLRSVHIVHIYDSGVHDGLPYMAMELLEGEDLARVLASEARVPLPQALGWIAQAARGLDVAHRAGVVHRDIKPSNLFLAEQDGEQVIKLLDFGIAKHLSDDGTQTTTGFVLGSPAYMSPEQARGRSVDARSDLWSLAAVLYHLVAGATPVEGDNSHDIAIKLCTEDVPPPSTHLASLGGDVDAFFAKALSRNPDARFDSVDEFLEALALLEEDIPLVAARPSEPPWSGKRLRAIGRDSETESISAVRSGAGAQGVESPSQGSSTPVAAPASPSRKTTGRVLLALAATAGLVFVGVLGVLEKPSNSDESPRTSVHAASEALPSLENAPVVVPSSLGAAPTEETPASHEGSPEPASPKTAAGESSPAVTGSSTPSALPHAGLSGARAPARPQSPPKPLHDASPPAAAPSIDPIFGLPTDPER